LSLYKKLEDVTLLCIRVRYHAYTRAELRRETLVLAATTPAACRLHLASFKP